MVSSSIHENITVNFTRPAGDLDSYRAYIIPVNDPSNVIEQKIIPASENEGDEVNFILYFIAVIKYLIIFRKLYFLIKNWSLEKPTQ